MAIASCIVYIVVTGCIFIHIVWMGDCWTLMGIFVDSANSDRQFFFKTPKLRIIKIYPCRLNTPQMVASELFLTADSDRIHTGVIHAVFWTL